MTFNPESQRLIEEHPELQIIDRDVWDRNQARLAEHIDRPFHKKKRVRFAFSGRVHCGKCGSTAIVTDGKYVCTGRKQKGICDNSRRVHREAVETTIFAKLKAHVLNAAVLGPALAAFRAEVDRAQADHAAKHDSQMSQLQDAEKRISNLLNQLAVTGETSFASQMLLEELERLGAQKRRLEGQIKQVPPSKVAGDTDDVIASITHTLDTLNDHLQGDDPEASRAKELLRGLISRVILTPTGAASDGRGAGDITITVEGPIANLIDLANLHIDRVTKNGHRPMFGLDNATVVWSFSFELQWRDPRLATVRADLPVIARLLDEADVPVSMASMAKALGKTEQGVDPDGDRSPDHRALNAVAYLQGQSFTRCINMRSTEPGYVWIQRGLTDDDWKARIAEPPMTRVIPVIRVTPPEAVPVILGPQPS